MAYGSTSPWLERGYIAVVNKALSRSTVAFSGEHYQLPLPDGPGKPLKLTIAPVSEHIRFISRQLGRRTSSLPASWLMGGWPSSTPPSLHQSSWTRCGPAALGSARASSASTSSQAFHWSWAQIPVSVLIRSVATQPSIWAGWAVGRRTSTTSSRRMGFGETAAMVQELFLSRRHRDAMAAVPFDFIDQTSLLGDRDRIADRLQMLAASGVTTCALVPYGGSSKRSSTPSR